MSKHKKAATEFADMLWGRIADWVYQHRDLPEDKKGAHPAGDPSDEKQFRRTRDKDDLFRMISGGTARRLRDKMGWSGLRHARCSAPQKPAREKI